MIARKKGEPVTPMVARRLSQDEKALREVLGP
jgi:hypothetical protein